ncbi:hypothetical protein SAMN05444050_3001 [Afipia sp. GAS231]|nr:hypothetical protein SAMN05444050_3001 [Afipia sp. GAS231]
MTQAGGSVSRPFCFRVFPVPSRQHPGKALNLSLTALTRK